MKWIFILLFLPLLTFSQTKEEFANEIIKLQQTINYQKLDIIKLRIEIHDLNRFSTYEIKRQQWVIDSIRWSYKKVEKERDSLISFKKQIYTLSSNTVMLYQMKNDESLYYINLNSYKLIQKGDNILLVPILDESKWEKPKMYGYPQPDNLSIHLHPHIQGNTIKN